MSTSLLRIVLPLVVSLSAAAPCAVQDVVPKILFSTAPSVLVSVDGDPVYREISGTNLSRVVNSKALILRDEVGAHYLRIAGGWMQAYMLTSWWEISGVPPTGANLALKQAIAAKDADLMEPGPDLRPLDPNNDVMPIVFVSTRPAVLIITDGPARFATVAGTSLEYLVNTSAKVFREPTDQELYLLTSGRWYRSWKQEGPWQFVATTDLPADFQKIPDSLLKNNPGGLQ